MRTFGALLITALGLVSAPLQTHAAIPPLLNYQGILQSGGNPVNSTVSVVFTLYSVASGGTALWTETVNVTPDNEGRFNVLLGSTTPVPDSVFRTDAYLGIKVGADAEMSTRHRIVSVGYSYRVGTVDSALGGTITSKVSIGPGHTNSGVSGFVAGESNDLSSDWGTISGGRLNDMLDGEGDVIGGGRTNVISDGDHCVIGGGLGGTIRDNWWSVIGGGAANRVDSGGRYNAIVGGFANRIYKDQYGATITGGSANRIGQPGVNALAARAFATDSVIGGTVVGGVENTASGDFATVAGGYRNEALAYAAFAAGSGAHALHSGSFVWADSSDTMSSTGPDQFLIQANGGVGIGTDSPSEQLEVAGTVYSSIGGFRFPDNTVQTTAAVGLASGWTDASGAVILVDPLDSVGIGTSLPTAKLEVVGDVAVTGSARIGPGCTNPGGNAFVAGQNNTASGQLSTVAGGDQNTASGLNATVAGGTGNMATASFSAIGGGFTNSASGNRSTIAGGYGNFSSAFASTVGGGAANMATGDHAVVAGGNGNFATGQHSAIPGGILNRARGEGSFAAGSHAQADHDGAVVISAYDPLSGIGDSSYSSAIGQMLLRADGGFYLSDTGGTPPVDAIRFLNTSTGAYLSQSGAWTNLSDANTKENFQPVDGEELLARLAALPIQKWNYRVDGAEIQHIGPTAQDFHQAFGVGENDRTLSTIDPAGVALAAIQQLYRTTKLLEDRTSELENLKAEVAELKARIK
ncbi:MAG: tail fiber domain-containing protein [Candidatus Zixiibacteriota bacterium]